MIYTGTNTTIRLDTGIDLSQATDIYIRYRKPNHNEGAWQATVDGEEIIYKTKTSDLDIPGIWHFQAVVKINGNLIKGRIVNQKIYKPIKQ